MGGLEIHRGDAAPGGGLAADRRLCVTADRSRVVEPNSPDAAYLFATPGQMVSAEDVARYGLVQDPDGRLQWGAAAEPAIAEEPPKPPKAKGGKSPKPGADA